MTKVANPALLVKMGLRQNYHLEPLHHLVRQRPGQYLHADIVVELSKTLLTHLGTVQTYVLLREEKLDKEGGGSHSN